MNPSLLEVIDNNRLERLDKDRFLGRASSDSWHRVYGGQVLAQCISAADQTMNTNFVIHSLHGYFLRPGNPTEPLIYEVNRVRDGQSFCTRRITVSQGEKAIFEATLSYQVPEQGLEHEMAMPEVAGPEGLLSDRTLLEPLLPKEMRESFGWPIEFRQLEPIDFSNPQPGDPNMQVWFRTADKIGDDPALHRQLLAYASDSPILLAALRPHGLSHLNPQLQMASIDHALWYHSECRVDEWMLYVLDSHRAVGGRGLVAGRIYQRDGTLVASSCQEGLVRKR
ncbi:MAG: acyl-CoA thioesterase II [Halioglobus sp.]